MGAHFPEPEETQKRHVRNQWQGYQSTTKPAKCRQNDDGDNAMSTDGPPVIADAKDQDVFMCTFDLKDEMQAKILDRMKDKIYSDQTGKFPVRSSRSY